MQHFQSQPLGPANCPPPPSRAKLASSFMQMCLLTCLRLWSSLLPFHFVFPLVWSFSLFISSSLKQKVLFSYHIHFQMFFFQSHHQTVFCRKPQAKNSFLFYFILCYIVLFPSQFYYICSWQHSLLYLFPCGICRHSLRLMTNVISTVSCPHDLPGWLILSSIVSPKHFFSCLF